MSDSLKVDLLKQSEKDCMALYDLDTNEYWKVKHALAHAEHALRYLPDLQPYWANRLILVGQNLGPQGGISWELFDPVTATVLFTSGVLAPDHIKALSHENLRDWFVSQVAALKN